MKNKLICLGILMISCVQADQRQQNKKLQERFRIIEKFLRDRELKAMRDFWEKADNVCTVAACVSPECFAYQEEYEKYKQDEKYATSETFLKALRNLESAPEYKDAMIARDKWEYVCRQKIIVQSILYSLSRKVGSSGIQAVLHGFELKKEERYECAQEAEEDQSTHQWQVKHYSAPDKIHPPLYKKPCPLLYLLSKEQEDSLIEEMYQIIRQESSQLGIDIDSVERINVKRSDPKPSCMRKQFLRDFLDGVNQKWDEIIKYYNPQKHYLKYLKMLLKDTEEGKLYFQAWKDCNRQGNCKDNLLFLDAQKKFKESEKYQNKIGLRLQKDQYVQAQVVYLHSALVSLVRREGSTDEEAIAHGLQLVHEELEKRENKAVSKSSIVEECDFHKEVYPFPYEPLSKELKEKALQEVATLIPEIRNNVEDEIKDRLKSRLSHE